jgi:DNA-binding MurR/RpiR family transcriptional regulator
METVAKQTPTSSSEIAKLIRKLRWAGLEEEAEQLEKELEQHAATETVVSIQNETD